MNTSPSQLEVFKLCPRKWWFFYVRKIKIPQGKQFLFGTILHAACERYLLGKELWPAGWEIDQETGERVLPAEAALIQVLVQGAIQAGYLEKRPDGEVEQWAEIRHDGVNIRMKQDYRTPDRVEDHKTSKSERYMKSAEALKKSIQMMLYGKERLQRYRVRGELPPKVITLVHNQFKKDFNDPMVRRREAEVTPAEIDRFWENEIVPLLEQMLEVRKVKNPFDIPDPEPQACRAFGGCEMVGVCGGAEELLTFERRMSNLITSTSTKQPMSTKSPSDFLNSRKKSKAEPAQVAVNPPKPEAVPVKAEQAAPKVAAAGYTSPPWGSLDCPLCGKSDFPGFNVRTGKPCRICPTKSGTNWDGYEWRIDNGIPVWFKEGEAPATGPTPEQPRDAGEKVEHVEEKSPIERMQEAPTQDDLDQILLESESLELSEDDADELAKVYSKRTAELAEPVAEEKPKRRRQPTKAKEPEPEPVVADVAEQQKSPGLTLLIGCAPLKGMSVVFAEDILAGIEGYWSNTGAFDRREKLRRAIVSSEINFNGMTIVQQGRDPDVDNLISSLLPLATVVIRGTIQ